MIRISVPVRTRTPGNGRRHWAIDAREAAKQRQCVTLYMLTVRQKLPPFPVKVTFTRYGGRMDQHNLPGALKHVIDAVAKVYGVDDGDPRWRFEFKQEKCNVHCVAIEIEPSGNPG